MALVPENALRPRQSERQQGLTAEYFNNLDFSGTPALTRVDSRGYFMWDMQDANTLKSLQGREFSLRWSGTIQGPQTGDYKFGVLRAECHSCGRTDSARVYIGDQLVLNDA
ncbi:MAG: hypothetical protein JO051_07135, partial [Acidobacteriaceae bacterium]|nr:hypothetical protein [Acidobacteriaceae bacterium]